MSKIHIGIITMHRVSNVGSILQAYSLQRKISELGYQSEIIDYCFPNRALKPGQRIENCLRFLVRPRYRRFTLFFKRHLRLSKKTYRSKAAIMEHPPVYDLLITGSDQVWNTTHIKQDYTYMCDFAYDTPTPCISYAASIASASMPAETALQFRKFISRYKHIAVREKAAQQTILELLNRDSAIVCDPTMLINKEQWNKLAERSQIKLKRPYILVYALTYSFDPYPQLEQIIQKIQATLNIDVVSIYCSPNDALRQNSLTIKDCGPIEFVSLIKNASFLITTSFHGIVFSSNLGVPFCSVVNAENKSDLRLKDFLQYIGEEHRIIDVGNPVIDPMVYQIDDSLAEKVEVFRQSSIDYLQSALNDTITAE